MLLVWETKLRQTAAPKWPLTPSSNTWQHFRPYSAIISSDLTALFRTSSVLLSPTRPSSWSESKWKQPLVPISSVFGRFEPPERWTLLLVTRMSASVWQRASQGTNTAGPGLGDTDVSIQYGGRSTYGTTNGQLVWWMTPVSREKGEQIRCVCLCLCVYVSVCVCVCLYALMVMNDHTTALD